MEGCLPRQLPPPRTQLVYERIIWGMGGQEAHKYTSTDTLLCSVYRPFGYAMPPPSPGCERRYRLHAHYSDNMTTPELDAIGKDAGLKATTVTMHVGVIEVFAGFLMI